MNLSDWKTMWGTFRVINTAACAPVSLTLSASLGLTVIDMMTLWCPRRSWQLPSTWPAETGWKAAARPKKLSKTRSPLYLRFPLANVGKCRRLVHQHVRVRRGERTEEFLLSISKWKTTGWTSFTVVISLEKQIQSRAGTDPGHLNSHHVPPGLVFFWWNSDPWTGSSHVLV